MNPSIKKYLSEIGRRGGKKSKRKLSTDQARAMVKRKAKKSATRASPLSQPRKPTRSLIRAKR